MSKGALTSGNETDGEPFLPPNSNYSCESSDGYVNLESEKRRSEENYSGY